jgi:hypothetical protein
VTDAPPSGAVFEFKRKRALLAAANGCALFPLAAFVTMALIIPIWPAKIVAALGAALGLYIIANSVREIFLPGPGLRIGPDGLLYPPLHPEPIPWSDITDVRVQRGTHWDRVAQESAPEPAGDVISFDVRDPDRYKGGYFIGLARNLAGGMGYAPIVLNRPYIDATSQQILDAIRLYWRGTIPESRTRTS